MGQRVFWSLPSRKLLLFSLGVVESLVDRGGEQLAFFLLVALDLVENHLAASL